MVGTRDLHRLLGYVERAGGTLVLVGDDHQLPAIHAGGAFTALAGRLPAIELHDNFRQQDPLERDRALALRHGAVDAWLHTGLRAGRVILGEHPARTRELLVADWLGDRLLGDPEEAIMLARSNADVRWLNDAARHHLKASGELAGEELTIAGRSFAIGDLVVARRNLPGGLLDNGTRATVVGLDHEQRQLTVRTLGGARTVTLDTGYLEARHLHHAYALTAHLAQGLSVDRARILGSPDGHGREWAYSAATRHRIAAHFYLTAPDPDRLQLPDQDPLHRIRQTLGHSTAKTLALVTTTGRPPEGITAASTVELRARRDVLRELLATIPAKVDEQRSWHQAQLTTAREQLAAARERLAQHTTQLAAARRRDRPEVEHAIARDRGAIDAWQTEATNQQQALAALPSPGHRDAWIEQHGPAVRELATIEHELHRRQTPELRAKLALALTNPDPDLHARLGQRPEDAEQGPAWDAAAQALAAYRHHTGNLDLDTPHPDHLELHRDATRALDTHERGLRHDGPGLGLGR